MKDSKGRKMIDLVIDKRDYPDYMVMSAVYEDDLSDVSEEELCALSCDDIDYYVASRK